MSCNVLIFGTVCLVFIAFVLILDITRFECVFLHVVRPC